MSKLIPGLTALLALSACVAPAVEAPPPAAVSTEATSSTIGGAAMDPAKSIAENIARSRDHATLVAALRAAALSDHLSSGGPFTLFAATNEAFARLPQGTMDALNAPANRPLLARVLNYHIVPGSKTRAQIAADSRGGVATYRTAEGGSIRVSLTGQRIVVADLHGNRSSVTSADTRVSNGVIHVIDGVLLPAI